ncbi:outer membrane porin HofQ [Rubripirellula amarantea]|uniref:Outer membrane porin HofQ n=1 Tax=Rubripirellula amarantea TaxID=2527999 RepID=A0A5C5WEX6_9BACT|nr:general secretion pathway protein GspD [Rubripirellula amarantea]TWT49190.1 outer membrane porin HofQ [Rubripirellula amarantea]
MAWSAIVAMMAMSTQDAIGQSTFGQVPSSSSPSQVTVPTVAQAQAKLNQVRDQIANRDYAAAVESYRTLSPMVSQLPNLQPEAAKLHQQLVGIGIDPALLALPPRNLVAPTATGSVGTGSTVPNPAANGPSYAMPSAVQRMPAVAGAMPIQTANADPDAAKREALRLIAIGRAALDRGDAAGALQIAQQAQSLGVPEKAFAAGEPRVWQFVLDAESAAKRSGIASSGVMQTSGQQTSGNFIQPALAMEPATGADDNGAIAQMLFNGGAANAGETPNQIQQVQNTESTYASQAYDAGMQALLSGDREEARKQFKEAWRVKEGLSVTQQNQLKDKLTLLQPTRLVPSAKPNENGELSEIDKTRLEAEAKTRRLYKEVTAELASVETKKSDAPLDALDELERLRRRVDSSDIDEQAKRSLAVLVDRAIKEQKSYVDANRAKIELDIQNASVRTDMEQADKREAATDHQVSMLVDEFNALMKDRRFNEAELIAKQVAELKPGDPVSIQMFHNSRMGVRMSQDQEIRAAKEDSFAKNMLDAERSMIGPDPDMPLTHPDAETWIEKSRRRLDASGDRDSRLSEAEKEISRKLASQVSIKYRNRPLGEVLEDLSAMTGIPMIMDERALTGVRVSPESPISLMIPNSIKLESALNLILQPLQLAHMIQNDVLMITSQEVKDSNVFPVTYRVTDLVTPIPNFATSYEDGLAGALRNAYQMTQPRSDVQLVPMSATDIGNRMSNAMNPMGSNPNVLGQYNPLGSQGGFGPNNPPMGGGAGGSSFADFQSLIDLIQNTVDPESWDALGGQGTMQEYPQNLSLVISTTSETHEKISDLLESLRRLQNLQITIEVRFITLADTFAEQIGVDFNFQVDDNTREFPDDDEGPSVTVGYDGIGGAFTPDLDIAFNNQSFISGGPAFGGQNLGTAANLGFAVLSDIEAYFFIQAIQTDNRTNVMQAPKVTLFDGQLASISDFTQRPFVTSVTPVVGDFAVAQQPVIVVLNEGTSLNVQGIVSDDKRFVRLTLVPFFSQIGDVNTFTYEGRRTTSRSTTDQEDTNGDGVVDENDATDSTDESDVIEGTTVQLPVFAFTTISTTVSVPDGGTILLGGIKRMREGRAERGVPMLSKIPYLSRLFKNVTVGREASSLMMMVTPRIIIQEEEELAQTGFDPTQQ